MYRTGPPLYLLESRSIHPMLFSIVYSFALEGSCHVYAKLAYRLQNGHKSCLALQSGIWHDYVVTSTSRSLYISPKLILASLIRRSTASATSSQTQHVPRPDKASKGVGAGR